MEEIWKDIEGYEGLYQVSNLGRVRSLDKTVVQPNSQNGEPMIRRMKGMIRKLYKDKRSGYLYVNMAIGGKYKNCTVHRLVAKAFIQNPHNLPLINHKNEIKQDNRVENLEWCTHFYNTNYGSGPRKIGIALGKRVEQIDENGNVIKVYYSMLEAARSVGGKRGTEIKKCCIGIRKTAYGYRWRYADE